MSRAFVKETDAPEPPIPERPISTAPNRVTTRGARLIVEAVAALKQDLRRASNDAAAAAIQRALRYWHSRQASMQVIPARAAAPEVVGFGVRVTFRRGSITSAALIVGEDEADPATGLIAWTAPLARALEGAEVGDVVELEAGHHREQITVVAISLDNTRSE